MRWTTDDRKNLADLARDQEELGIVQARLDSLPEQAKLEELQAQKREELSLIHISEPTRLL